MRGMHSKLGFSIKTRAISQRNALIIAEVGTSHQGSLDKGLELVSAAAEAGADCVKFQHVYAQEIIHPNTGFVPLPGGMIPLYERFVQVQVSIDFLARMKESCESKGVLFLCTPFGLRSAAELVSLKVDAMKIASPELNHLPLVNFCAKSALPTILSSGVSLLRDIERALAFFKEGQAALLHCVTAYPAPEEDYNLFILGSLSRILGVPCGVSDHSLDPILVPALASAHGACIIEKHIRLSRAGDGLDDPIALDPADCPKMARTARKFAGMGAEEATAELSGIYGEKKVAAVLGTGVKRLAESERLNYSRTNRSLHATRPIARGERFTEENVALLRTEKILNPGLHPEFMDLVLGRIAAGDVPDGEGIGWDSVGSA